MYLLASLASTFHERGPQPGDRAKERQKNKDVQNMAWDCMIPICIELECRVTMEQKLKRSADFIQLARKGTYLYVSLSVLYSAYLGS